MRLSPTIYSLADISSDTPREVLGLMSSIAMIELDKVDLDHLENITNNNGPYCFTI